MALRNRHPGAGFKPLDGAVVKIHGIEQALETLKKGGEVRIEKTNDSESSSMHREETTEVKS